MVLGKARRLVSGEDCAVKTIIGGLIGLNFFRVIVDQRYLFIFYENVAVRHRC